MKQAYTYEGGSRKYRLARVDWILLLLAVFLVFSAGAYLARQRRTVQATRKIHYTICISGVNTKFGEANGTWETLLPNGARVTSGNGTATLGRVKGIAVHPSVVASVEEGEFVWIEASDAVDLFVEIVGDGVVKYGDGIRMQDVRIAAGSTGDFRIGGYYAQKATVIFVESEKME